MKRMLAVFLALVMVFSLAACGAQTPENSDNTPSSPNSSTPDNNVSDTPEVNESAPVYGGELTMMWKEINNYYEPGMMTSYGYGSVWMEGLWSIDLSSDNAYDGSFVTYDQLVGQLADNWTWDEAAGTLTVNIREDVYFHDKEPINGRQLVAEDVKYSYDRLTDPALQSLWPWKPTGPVDFICWKKLQWMAISPLYSISRKKTAMKLL